MWVLLFAAALSLIMAVLSTFGPESNLTDALVSYAIALGLFGIWRFLRRSANQQTEFIDWFIANRVAIEEGTATYNGVLISPRTELTQFSLAISLVVVSLKHPSRFYIVGQESTLSPKFFFTVTSLILGWWGLPFGPVFTISAVSSNLGGGRRRQIGVWLAELSGHQKEVVRLTKRAAMNARRIMFERGFPDGSAVQVEFNDGPSNSQYSIAYDDLPPTDGSVWKSEAWGIPVIVRKCDELRLEGLVVDFIDGEYRFRWGSID